MSKTDDPALDPQLDFFIEAVLGKKVVDPVVLDVRCLTSIADVFIICSGRSNRQVTAIADHVEQTLKTRGVRPLSVEGKKEGHWVLLDYGHVVMHVFDEPLRRFYDLEGLWVDARRIETDSLIQHKNI